MPQTNSTLILETLLIGSGRLHPRFAPAPISDWTLMPNNPSPQREQLWQLIERTLTSIREEVMKTAKTTSQAEDYSRPWAIIRLLPDARRYTVARFFNRQDAEDHRRFLNRFMPAAEFEVLLMFPTSSFNTQLANKKIKFTSYT
jgi:hypothetical protein